MEIALGTGGSACPPAQRGPEPDPNLHPDPHPTPGLPKPKPRQVCPAAQRFAALVARKLAASGGAALFVDYGKDGPPASSLRGIVDHAFVDPLLRWVGGGR